MAARAGSAPRDLVLKTKRTMQDIRSVSTQRAAVDHELGPQAWSTRQAAFQERLAKLKAKISSKS